MPLTIKTAYSDGQSIEVSGPLTGEQMLTLVSGLRDLNSTVSQEQIQVLTDRVTQLTTALSVSTANLKTAISPDTF
jgi:catalase (peroxidase I)